MQHEKCVCRAAEDYRQLESAIGKLM